MHSYYIPTPEGDHAEIVCHKVAQQVLQNLDIKFDIDVGFTSVKCQIIDRNLALIIVLF